GRLPDRHGRDPAQRGARRPRLNHRRGRGPGRGDAGPPRIARPRPAGPGRPRGRPLGARADRARLAALRRAGRPASFRRLSHHGPAGPRPACAAGPRDDGRRWMMRPGRISLRIVALLGMTITALMGREAASLGQGPKAPLDGARRVLFLGDSITYAGTYIEYA